MESFDLVLWGGQLSKAGMFDPAMAELNYFHLGERNAPGRLTRDRSLDTFGGRFITNHNRGRSIMRSRRSTRRVISAHH